MYAIYVRVSTDEQAKHGYSLGDQLSSCHERYKFYGIEQDIVEYVDDGYSGEFLDRPALNKLRDDIQSKKIKMLMIFCIDRLGRESIDSQYIAKELLAANVKIVSVKEGEFEHTEEGKAIYGLFAIIAGLEKAKIRDRTIRGKTRKAELGKIPANYHVYGYDWDRVNSQYVVNEEQAEVIRLIYKLCLEGMGFTRIIKELHSRGIMTPKGKPFARSTIHQILSREDYIGKTYYNRSRWKQVGQGKHSVVPRDRSEWIELATPPIVSTEDWYKVQKQKKMNSKLSKRNTRHDYLLRGMIFCDKCGGRMIGEQASSNVGKYHYYKCYNVKKLQFDNKPCDAKMIRADIIDEYVWQSLVDLVNGIPGIIEQAQPKDYSSDLLELQQEEQQLIKKREKVRSAFRKSLLTEDEFEEDLKLISKELEQVKGKQQALLSFAETMPKTSKVSASDIINAVTFEDKRKILLDGDVKLLAVKTGTGSSEFNIVYEYVSAR